MQSNVLCVNDRQEPFSTAYIGAIAAAAGYGFTILNGATNPDRCSIDAQISIPNTRNILIQDLKVQAKCTYHHEPKKTYFPFEIEKKNYDDIRLNRNPHLLVVVNVPRIPSHWILFNDNSMELMYSCYYMSLKGMGEMDVGKKTKVIRIPISNILNTSRLSEIMSLLAVGKFILHNNEVIDLP
jgi:hypothetical protein